MLVSKPRYIVNTRTKNVGLGASVDWADFVHIIIAWASGSDTREHKNHRVWELYNKWKVCANTHPTLLFYLHYSHYGGPSSPLCW